MVSHKKIKEILKNWGLQNEKLAEQEIESVGLSTATPIKTVEDKFVVASEDLYFYVTKRLEGKQIKASKMFF